jgi:hypothetical protein
MRAHAARKEYALCARRAADYYFCLRHADAIFSPHFLRHYAPDFSLSRCFSLLFRFHYAKTVAIADDFILHVSSFSSLAIFCLLIDYAAYADISISPHCCCRAMLMLAIAPGCWLAEQPPFSLPFRDFISS